MTVSFPGFGPRQAAGSRYLFQMCPKDRRICNLSVFGTKLLFEAKESPSITRNHSKIGWNTKDMFEKHDHYILIALIEACRRLGDVSLASTGVASVTLEGASNVIAEQYEISLPLELLSKSFGRLSAADVASHYVSVRKSSFANDRYLVKFDPVDETIEYFDSDEVWQNLRALGDDWMRESLKRIVILHKDGQLTSGTPLKGAVPASDRYVSRNDNEAQIEEIEESLLPLQRTIGSSNSLELEKREIALAEIAIFESTIAQPRLSIELIERFLEFCRNQLTVWVGAAGTKYIVEKLVALLKQFVASMGSGL